MISRKRVPVKETTKDMLMDRLFSEKTKGLFSDNKAKDYVRKIIDGHDVKVDAFRSKSEEASTDIKNKIVELMAPFEDVFRDVNLEFDDNFDGDSVFVQADERFNELLEERGLKESYDKACEEIDSYIQDRMSQVGDAPAFPRDNAAYADHMDFIKNKCVIKTVDGKEIDDFWNPSVMIQNREAVIATQSGKNIGWLIVGKYGLSGRIYNSQIDSYEAMKNDPDRPSSMGNISFEFEDVENTRQMPENAEFIAQAAADIATNNYDIVD